MATKLRHPPKARARNRERTKSTADVPDGGKPASRESGGQSRDRETRASTESSPAPGDARSTAAPIHPFGEPTPAAPSKDPVETAVVEPSPHERKPGEPSADVQIEEIRAAERKVAEAETAWVAAREEAKERHKQFDAAVSNMRRTVRKWTDPLPLFDGPAAVAAPEEWRRVSIDELGLKPRVAKALRDFELETIGAVADYTAKSSLHAITGLGDKAIEEIDDAMTKFWEDHPEHTRPASEPEPAKADDSSDDGEDAGDDQF